MIEPNEVDRSTVRASVADLLRSQLVSSDYRGITVRKVYHYRPADLLGESPVITVGPGGTGWTRVSRDLATPVHYIEIDIFVLYVPAAAELESIPTPAPVDEALAHELLDLLSFGISRVIQKRENQRTPLWQSLAWEGTSSVELIFVGGDAYLHETIRVRVE